MQNATLVTVHNVCCDRQEGQAANFSSGFTHTQKQENALEMVIRIFFCNKKVKVPEVFFDLIVPCGR